MTAGLTRPPYPAGVKEFAVYTLLRLLLFAACLGIVMGIWAAVNDGQVHAVWAVVLAFVLSGIASYVMLNRPREAFARRVDARASRAAERFEAMRSREDAD